MTDIHVLHTGRYKTLTNKICNDIIALIKRTEHLATYKRAKILYNANEDRPAFESQPVLTLGVYTSIQLDMIFSVKLKINRDTTVTKILVDGYADEGVTDTDGNIELLPSIEINVLMPGINPQQYYTRVMSWLKDVVRHEIEHLTQRGINSKPTKRRNLNLSKRAVICDNPDEYWKYYILADEIEPNLHGLRSMSKYNREPYKKTIDDYLSFLIDTGTIQHSHKPKILAKWRRVAKRLNLPKI